MEVVVREGLRVVYGVVEIVADRRRRRRRRRRRFRFRGVEGLLLDLCRAPLLPRPQFAAVVLPPAPPPVAYHRHCFGVPRLAPPPPPAFLRVGRLPPRPIFHFEVLHHPPQGGATGDERGHRPRVEEAGKMTDEEERISPAQRISSGRRPIKQRIYNNANNVRTHFHRRIDAGRRSPPRRRPPSSLLSLFVF